MNDELTSESQRVCRELQALRESATASKDVADTAAQWISSISPNQDYLQDRAHPIVFIGSVGVGKSSLIGVAANLIIGGYPTDKASLKANSVLAIGGGRTTLCEVQIRSSQGLGRGEIGFEIDPLPEDEMRREIEIFAQDEWLRRQPDVQRCGEDDTDPSSQEVYRAIRGLTGYVERTEVYREGGIRRTRTVRPLDEVIKRFPTSDGFADHLIERANMPARTETQWWWSDLDKDNLRALKELFEAVNQGKEPSAMLPRRMTVYVPRPLPESTAGLQLTLIDTRGLDGGVEARGDLQALLCDPRSLIVLCACFKNTPGDSQRALLRSMAADA